MVQTTAKSRQEAVLKTDMLTPRWRFGGIVARSETRDSQLSRCVNLGPPSDIAFARTCRRRMDEPIGFAIQVTRMNESMFPLLSDRAAACS